MISHHIRHHLVYLYLNVMCSIILQNGFTVAYFDSQWISSPNLSPFHRILMNKVSREAETCPIQTFNNCLLTESLWLNQSHNSNNNKINSNNTKNLSRDDDDLSDVTDDSVHQSALLLGKPTVLVNNEVEKRIDIEENDPINQQPPIVTFDEWTKEKLKNGEHRKMKNQQKALENGSNKMKVNLNENKMASNEVSSNINNMRQEAATQRNYASRDCGAKVLFSNDEAENRNAVLNEKERDDYMRNPCGRAHNKWFIIELCETISLTAIELANFELFSSGPERVRISLSERYPTNEWNVLDEITAADSRDIQRFPINANGYAKFIRIELLTHHGNEHYCTLSMVRIFGISMVDEYEYEAQADADSMPEVVDNQIDIENDSKEVESEKQNDVMNKQSDGAALKIARNKSEIQTKLNDSKDEQIALMDVMVNAVNKIAIKNIKIAFQSAFLGGWRSDTGEVVMNAGPLKQQCATCPLPADSSLKAVLFCRTFFAYGFSDSNNSTFIDNKPSSQISSNPINVTNSNPEKITERKRNNHHQWNISMSSVQRRFVNGVRMKKKCSLNENSSSNSPQNSNDKKDPPSSHHSNITANQPDTQPQSQSVHTAHSSSHNNNGNYQSLPGVSLSHKESIFLKLNKRINALELNMSLSSEYLSELSRRYVKQLNESRLYSDRLLKSVENVTQNTLRNAKQKFDKQITEIKREMKQISLMVKTLWSNFKTFECPLSTTSTVNNNDDNQISSSSSVQKHLGHVPYPNGYLWTIEQLIILIVISQICAIFVVLLLERCYRHYAYWNKSTLNNVIDERFELLFKSYSTRQDGVEEYRECMCSNDNLKSSQTVTSEPNYELKKIKLESSDIIDGIVRNRSVSLIDNQSDISVYNDDADIKWDKQRLSEHPSLSNSFKNGPLNVIECNNHNNQLNHFSDNFPDKNYNVSLLKSLKPANTSRSGSLNDSSWHIVKPNKRRNRKRVIFSS